MAIVMLPLTISFKPLSVMVTEKQMYNYSGALLEIGLIFCFINQVDRQFRYLVAC